jgi:hypothetical protein
MLPANFYKDFLLVLTEYLLFTGPTASPTVAGESVVLTPYTLSYTISTTTPPLPSMLDELTLLTDTYLDEFFRFNFGSGSVVFNEAQTIRVGFEFPFFPTPPAEVDYETTTLFFPAAIVPSAQELDTALAAAFQGTPLQEYLDIVRNLPDPNFFNSVTDIDFQLTSEVAGRAVDNSTVLPSATPQDAFDLPLFPTTGNTDQSGGGPGIALAAGAGVLTLALAGFFVYRRRSDQGEEAGKFLDHDGHMTVAGDTYLGTLSMDSRSQSQTHHSVSQSSWSEHQDALSLGRASSPHCTIPEEDSSEMDEESISNEFRSGGLSSYDDDDDDDDDSFPERLLSELDDVTL